MSASGGYSATSLWKKLGVKPGGRLMVLAGPEGWPPGEPPEGASLQPAPAAGAETTGGAGGAGDVTILFARSRAQLAVAIEPLSRRIHPSGALWVAWPRRAAGHESDIREQDIRDLALPLGLVDNKVAALGEDWSGLRVVWRLERRSGAARG